MPNNALYQLLVDYETLKAEFITMPLGRKNLSPPSRTCHSMVAINEENLLLLGGVQLSGSNLGVILRDLWLYNTEECSWYQVDPANGLLRGFC